MQPAAQANGAQQEQRGGGWGATIMRMLMFYFMFNFFMKKPAPTDSTGKPLPALSNMWRDGQRFDLSIYFSEKREFNDFDNQDSLIWEQKNLYYDWTESNSRDQYMEIPVPQTLRNNGTLYAHIYFTKQGFSPDPSSPQFDSSGFLYTFTPMNKFLVQKKHIVKNLISGETTIQEKKTGTSVGTLTEVVSYWKPNLTLTLVHDQTKYPRGSIPPQMEPYMKMNIQENTYEPVIFVNEFWLLREHLIAVNESVQTLPLTLSYYTLSMIKWQFYLQMEQSFSMQQAMGTAVEGESDEFKRMLVETNPYLLGITFVVTMLHSIFDFLAFKNDITFWKNKKSMEGMSVRTIFINTFCQFIIFLYLLDNDTSWVILISSGVGLLIESWKIKKAVNIRWDSSKWIPLSFEDKESYASKTKEYDQLAMKYLSWVLYPLIVGYSIYSLMYETHRSWYSWILSSLVGCVYTFGFIMMCPQLFINYKLKSVAHLPWKTFMYKALNTFIDDLFAFIIKMPTMHRLSCFRDDIIFLIYLYQRWIYRVDYSRVNEFGQGGDDTDEKSNENADSAPTTGATDLQTKKKQ